MHRLYNRLTLALMLRARAMPIEVGRVGARGALMAIYRYAIDTQ